MQGRPGCRYDSKPADLLIEMRGRYEGEGAIPDLSRAGMPLTTHRALVCPYMMGALKLERATHPSMLLVRTRELVCAWIVLGGDLHLVRREIGAFLFPGLPSLC